MHPSDVAVVAGATSVNRRPGPNFPLHIPRSPVCRSHRQVSSVYMYVFENRSQSLSTYKIHLSRELVAVIAALLCPLELTLVILLVRVRAPLPTTVMLVAVQVR